MRDAAEAHALRTRLQATVDHVAQHPNAHKLCLALALADGFSFQLVTCSTTRAAAALQLWLEHAVSNEREEPVELERISPYPLDPHAPGPATLDREQLARMVLEPLRTRSERPDRVVVIDTARASENHADAWQALFLRLNEQRNAIARDVAAPLVLILSPRLDAQFARLAPDLWSIRSVAVEIDDVDHQSVATAALQAFESVYQREQDVAALEQEVERARVHARRGRETPAWLALQVLLLRLAGAKQWLGELDQAEKLAREAAEIAEQFADDEAVAACRLALSDILVRRGDLHSALQLATSAIPMLERDDWTRANAWGRLADILQVRGELDEALRIRREEQLPIFEGLGDVRSRAETLGKVTDILQARGELDEALRILQEEVLPVYEGLGDVRSRAVTMGKVADILQVRGEFDEALRIRREEQLPVYERLGDVRSQAVTMGEVADILHARGELDEALRILQEEVLPVYERLGDVRGLLVGRFNLAVILAQRGREHDGPEIIRLLAQALHDAQRLAIPETEQITTLIRQLGHDPDAPPCA